MLPHCVKTLTATYVIDEIGGGPGLFVLGHEVAHIPSLVIGRVHKSVEGLFFYYLIITRIQCNVAGCHGLSWGCNSTVLVGKQTYHNPMRWVLGGTRQSILSFLPRQSCPPGFTLFLPLQQPRFTFTNPFPCIPRFVTVTVILGLIAHNSIIS
jgi:hypothetical protein